MDNTTEIFFVSETLSDVSRTHNIMDIMPPSMSDNNKDTSYINAEVSDTQREKGNNHNTQSDVASSDAKRTERLSAGLYMVTDLISDTEPIKNVLREKSLALLSDMSVLRDTHMIDAAQRVRRAEDTVGEIIALLHVAYAGNLISEMNMRVLKEEYLVLHAYVVKGVAVKGMTERALAMLFEDSEGEKEMRVEESEKRNRVYEEKLNHLKGHIKDTRYRVSDRDNMSDKVRYTDEHTRSGRQMLVERTNYSSEKPLGKKGSERTSVDVMAMREKRRKLIVSVIKKKGHAGIKDISAAITDTSEKTVQRELAALVKEGLVKKKGEKRWSVYSLK